MSFHHKSGWLKQENKKHKRLGHKTTPLSDKRRGGRVGSSSSSAAAPSASMDKGASLLGVSSVRSRGTAKSLRGFTESAKQKRRQQTRERIQKSRVEQMQKKRLMASGLRRVVVLVFADDNDDATTTTTTTTTTAAAAAHGAAADAATTVATASSHRQLIATRLRNALGDKNAIVICPPSPSSSLLEPTREFLDALKLADLVCMATTATATATAASCCSNQLAFSLMRSQGMPSSIGIIVGLQNVKVKHRQRVRATATGALRLELGGSGEVKVLPFDTQADAASVARQILSTALKHMHWRDMRPYLLVESAEEEKEEGEVEEAAATSEFVTLRLHGIVRGGKLSPNDLIHIPDVGEYQLARIEVTEATKSATGSAMDDDARRILLPDDAQETLQTEHEPILLNNEQTWPTEEEILEAERDRGEVAATTTTSTTASIGNVSTTSTGARRVLVPKGTSKTQAAWFIGLDDEDDDDGDGDDDDENEYDARMRPIAAKEEKEWVNIDEEDAKGDEDDDNMDEEEDGDVDDGDDDDDDDGPFVEREPKTLEEMERDELAYPDEVDVRPGELARETYRGYIGLQNWRTSKWDKLMNLPEDYARIYRFANYARTRAAVLRRAEAKPIEAGTRVTLVLKRVPRVEFTTVNVAKMAAQVPLAVYGLLSHEQRRTVVHMAVSKHASYTAPVASGDRFDVQVGFRRFYNVALVFSENNTNIDKHKYEPFLFAQRPSAAMMYAPAMMPPSTVLVFNAETKALVATGTLIGPAPDRIVLRRVVLTAVPARLHRRYAVVRGMFHNVGDINYFKSIELWTKFGRRGYIKESVGTKGRMRITFDNNIPAGDTVCMSLYTRIFPMNY